MKDGKEGKFTGRRLPGLEQGEVDLRRRQGHALQEACQDRERGASLHRFVDLAPVDEAIKCFLPILTESNAAAMAFDGRSTFDTPVQQVQQLSIDPYDRLQGIMPERCACCTAPSPLIH